MILYFGVPPTKLPDCDLSSVKSPRRLRLGSTPYRSHKQLPDYQEAESSAPDVRDPKSDPAQLDMTHSVFEAKKIRSDCWRLARRRGRNPKFVLNSECRWRSGDI